MSTPGSNLLKRASRLIRLQPFVYFKYLSRALNDVRQWVSTFDEGQPLKGSVQSVPRNKYEYLGLDFQRDYVNLFVAKDIQDIDRDRTGDQFVFAGKVYQIESQTDWFLQDGWVECLAVKIGFGSSPDPVVPVPVRTAFKAPGNA